MTRCKYAINNRIVAKAIHVTSQSECSRRFGSNAKVKLVTGTVIGVVNKPTATGRSSWHVKGRFDIGGGTMKVATLNVRSVKMAPSESANDATEGTESGDQTGEGGNTGVVSRSNEAVEESTGNQIENSNRIESNRNNNDSDDSDSGFLSANEDEQILLWGSSGTASVESVEDEDEDDGREKPVGTSHGVDWFKYKNPNNLPLNGAVRPLKWHIRLATGETIHEGGDVNRSILPIDYFFHSFPEEQTRHAILQTNINLMRNNKRRMTREEFYKLLGILILITRFEFTSRATLWSRTTASKFIPAPRIGETTGMSRNRFDELWSHLRWSEQPVQRPADKTHAEHRWMLVDDMVAIFNKHREENFAPSEWICVDESMSRWYGLGGNWINIGLPMYVSIDRKPESGCEIQNAACGISGVMLRLLLVTSEEDSDLSLIEREDGIPHGTHILKYLTLPWANSGRGVCADSYFASVTSAEELMKIGLRFIGVVKTATKKFPMQYLSSIELLERRGQYVGVTRKGDDEKDVMMAYVWMDRDRRYFISTASTLQPGKPYTRVRWRQQERQDILDEDQDGDAVNNEEAVKQKLTIPQPKCSEIYYNTCGAIDKHNRHRQDTLMLEKKIETKTWDKRVTTSLFGMYVVDAWLMYKGATTDSLQPDPELNQQEFYTALAEDLIERGHMRRTRQSGRQGIVNPHHNNEKNNQPFLGASLIAVPKMKRKRNGRVTKYRAQGRCRVCYDGRPTNVCSVCKETLNELHYLCNPRSGRDCFERHYQDNHM